MRTIVFRFAVCAFLVLYSFCMTANSQQTLECLGETLRNCPPEPEKCGDQKCNVAITWEVNPNNPCELIPVFTASCGDNKKEPVNYRDEQFKYCTLAQAATGFDDSEAIYISCWKWRFCSTACTETTQTDGYEYTRPNPDAPANCVTFQARPIAKKVFKCNAGVSSGDAVLGEEIELEIECTGQRIPCRITE
jgi:hypothetical protein